MTRNSLKKAADDYLKRSLSYEVDLMIREIEQAANLGKYEKRFDKTDFPTLDFYHLPPELSQVGLGIHILEGPYGHITFYWE